MTETPINELQPEPKQRKTLKRRAVREESPQIDESEEVWNNCMSIHIVRYLLLLYRNEARELLMKMRMSKNQYVVMLYYHAHKR